MAIARVAHLSSGMLEIFDENDSRTGIMLIGTDAEFLHHTADAILVKIGGFTHSYDSRGQFIGVS